MELPQEIEVWYTIPAVRRELARRLVASNMTQREVAKTLDVTEAAVSQYLSNKRGTTIEYPLPMQKELSAAVERIKKGSDVKKEILALCQLMRENKVICEIHKKHGTVKDGCSSCFD
jgi:uncharacterized protein